VTLGEELRRIEHEIRKLKIAYDLYFIGASPRPPQDQRDAVKKYARRRTSGTPSRSP
jgi:hypothetical protein